MGEAFAQYALSSEKLYRDSSLTTQMITDLPSGNWRLSRGGGIDSAGGVVRHSPYVAYSLAKIIAHIREIAGGNLANT